MPNCKYEVVSVLCEKIPIDNIQNRLLEVKEGPWSVQSQKSKNVWIQRAGHDRWGVDKMVFVFCDDYLQNVYDFPYFFEWQDELNKVFQHLKIKHSQVVRCLFARMPCGVEIPVHHDTGYWVQHTHRVHVPLFTNESVAFKAGVNEEMMEKVTFEEGKAYELNNAGKHSVVNSSDNESRIHLILDYVPEERKERIKLAPRTVLYQTRRSLDIACNEKRMDIPKFMIIGVQKSGTTSLYDMMVQHPLVIPAKRKETHFFDWRWPDGKGELYSSYFHTDLLQKYRSVITGEATPSYILGGTQVISRIKQTAPNAKIIVVLRNPIERAYSHFKMTTDTSGSEEQLRNRGCRENSGMTFEDIINFEMKILQKTHNIHPTMSASEFDDDYLKSRSAFKHGGHSFLGRGLYALQLIPWLEAFGAQNVKVVFTEDLDSDVLSTTMNDLYQFVGLPPNNIADVSPKNTRSYDSLCPILREKLASFYAPHNERLFELLGKRQNWND